MLATESTELASNNWDFTPVFDLLRSSTYGGTHYPVHGSESTVPSQNQGQSGQDVDSASSPVSEVKHRRSYPRLGDFGSVWDLLNQDSKANESPALQRTTPPTSEVDQNARQPARVGTILKRASQNQPAPRNPTLETPQSTFKSVPLSSASKPQISKDTVAGSSSRSSTQPQAFTILKRAADTNNDDTVSMPPRTPSKAIIGTSNPIDTPIAKNKAKSVEKHTKPKNDVMLSESSADADSDSSTIIFDRPITLKPGDLAFVPSQLGTPDARADHYETPPSSYDELDSALNDDTIRNIVTTPTGIRVLPAAYKTATDRRIGLMTKLLKDFPEYAQLVAQVGRLKKKGGEPRPIHVFVDMSNVCLSLLVLFLSN